MTTYGTAADAQRAVDTVRGIHERIRGTTAGGVPYHAADPHLLGWVHAAETDSFLRAHERYGAHPLDAAGYDAYVADTARVAEALGVEDPPRDRRELAERLTAYRPELRATPEARAAARFLLFQPPCPSRCDPSTAAWRPTPWCCSRPGPAGCSGCPGCLSSRTSPYVPPDMS